MNKEKNADKRRICLTVCAVLFVYTALVLVICIFSRSFSETYCRTVSSFLRFSLSGVTGIFPFSLAEALLFLLPCAILLCEAVILIKRKFTFKGFLKRAFILVTVMFFLFVNVFGVCYFRKPLEDNMSFEIVSFSENELKEAAEFVKSELEKSCENVFFGDDGASQNPHSWKQMNKKIDYGFSRLEREYPFVSHINADAKRIALSRYMTYTHISGIFIPFTAEANVNTNYPEYVVAFSAAHEKAHQRGIAGEDEANFVAFLACLASGDDYLEYAGLLSMYDYFLDEAYKTDTEMYRELLENTDIRILREMYAYSVFFDEYRNSTASVVADKVNDTYIKTMGDSEGVKSYGSVVSLCTSYLLQKEALPY